MPARSCNERRPRDKQGAALRRAGRRETMARAMALPSGTVTLLFSDIEGSTRLLERLGAAL